MVRWGGSHLRHKRYGEVCALPDGAWHPMPPCRQGYLERRVEDRLYPFHERPSTRLSALTKQLAEMEESGATAQGQSAHGGSHLWQLIKIK